jgi:hypothetical protein
VLSKLFSREPETRIFFATDIHGSEVCWKKFLNSGKHYEANILILGGDMTGKALVPIVEKGEGRWQAELLRIATTSVARTRSRSSSRRSGGAATTRSAPPRTRLPS